MQWINKVGKRIEKLFERGLIDETVSMPADPLLPEPAEPYMIPAPDPLGAIFAKLRERDGCPHWHCRAIDDTPIGPEKVFHCPDCGLDYREITEPGKPWLVVDYAPVAS